MLTICVSQTKFKLLLTTLLAINTLTINAQATDSLILQHPVNNFWKKDFVKKTTVPLVLFSATALAWPHRETVREVRNRFIPDFKYRYDDYLQYAPAAAVLALNAFNVKGKHTPKRTLISYAFSMGIMGAMVNGIKSTSKVERPDGSSNNSFPSGHTATAFMNATMLDKEYGQYGYPLIGITGYAMATATALGRGLNNRHWITDVLTGAGVGIISTELGYFVTDQIMKNRGMNAPLKNNPVPISNNPGFVELHAGYAIATEKKLTGTAHENIFNKDGFNLGLEGAWFMNKNFGIGGELAFTSFPLNSEHAVLDPDIIEVSNGLYTQALGVKYLNIGPYFSLPLANNWFITAKVNAGISSGSNGNFILNIKPEYQNEFGTDELPYARYKPKTAFSWSAGIGIQKRIGRNTAIKAYTTYFGSVHKFDIEVLNDRDNNGHLIYEPLPETLGKTKYNNITFGLGITAFIW
ncbi:membrane-associated phospholipid phosphatase [Pedobacter cryoconitis]|uniref:Membrane-associated phospholipid phosphatase n=1 Tax=Pedobacter cryoconitis TaxID=188932 RepID=A0A7W8ZQC3_9SPHI|nr:phosphatase PAP2 family protein [Pedobacter cryoconitis]MBB5638264.1 membrane-associated phospholipid phosphatase [Pedobacter cryoconitis]